MIVSVTYVPTPPLLLPEIAGGSARETEELRSAALAAVADLVTADLDSVVIVGSGADPGSGGRAPGGSVEADYDAVADWSGFGVRKRLPLRAGVRPRDDAPVLPLPLATGVWLLDQARITLPRKAFHAPCPPDVAACDRLAAAITTDAGREALLVVGDGSAKRTDKAPGSFDARAEAFDAGVADALRSGDPVALDQLDGQLAAELQVGGWGAWRVAGVAVSGRRWTSEVRYDAAPYGVGYFVATWR